MTLHTMGQLVGATQNDIAFDSHIPIGAQVIGSPDCTVNAQINKEATTFTFQPLGCSPGATCESMRAIVISALNVGPIADGSLLYTCVVNIDDNAELGRDYPLACSAPTAGDPASNSLAASCTDGRISVAIACSGDCNGDDEVSIDELLKGVNIALGNLPAVDCPAFDTDANGAVTIDELLAAVSRALNACS